MKKALIIYGTPREKKDSETLQVCAYLRQKLLNNNYQVHDLNVYDPKSDIPFLDKKFIHLWLDKDKNSLDSDEQKLWNRKLELAQDFANYDLYVFAAPHWDGFYPTRMKDYLDLIAEFNLAFTIKDGKTIGLLKGEYIFIQAMGGVHVENENFGLMHINHMMKMFNITNLANIIIERTDDKSFWNKESFLKYYKAIDKLKL